MKFSKLVLSGVVSLACSAAFAQTGGGSMLENAYLKAKQVDPLYLAGLAEFEGNNLEADAAGMAYFPSLKLSSGQVETDGGGRRDSLSISQPLISADRWATMKEKEPRMRMADAQLVQREMDLAKRLYTAFSELTVARETLIQNRARQKALDTQLVATKRLLTLSQGTTTDVRDAEVKLLQARSEELRLRGQMQTAARQYASIVGEMPGEMTVSMTEAKGKSLMALAARVRDRLSDPTTLLSQNPNVVVAGVERELADLETFRSRSGWIPELNLVHTQTRINGTSDSFTGLNLSLPLSAQSFAATKSAGAKAAVTAQEAADVQRQTILEIERLKTVVEFGANEVAMQQAAVAAAELSVEANEKSFKGGVRSTTDVLNAIDVLYTAKTDLVIALLALSDGLLNLRLLEGAKAADSLNEVETTVLR